MMVLALALFPIVQGGPPAEFHITEPAHGWFWLALFRMPHADAVAVLIRADGDEANELAKREWARVSGRPAPLVAIGEAVDPSHPMVMSWSESVSTITWPTFAGMPMSIG